MYPANGIVSHHLTNSDIILSRASLVHDLSDSGEWQNYNNCIYILHGTAMIEVGNSDVCGVSTQKLR